MGALEGRIEPDTIDLIWAEGSIYTVGFDSGLALWRGLLREGGVLACTELAWLTPEPSDAARRLWGEGYPAMRSVQANLDAAGETGYASVGHFALPASDWIDTYYGPLGGRVATLQRKYAGDAEACGVLDKIDAEIDLFRRAGQEYGYIFYILRRRGR